MKRLNVLLVLILLSVFLGISCQTASGKNSSNEETVEFVEKGGLMPVIVDAENGSYCGTWSSSQYYDGTKSVPISNRYTLRQIVHTSIGGKKIRLSFSNRYGESELVINSVHIAKANGQGTGKIFTETDTIVPFDGDSGVTIPAGQDIYSDTFEFEFDPLAELAITIYYEKIPSKITGHVGSRTNSFYSPGNCLSEEKLPYFGKFAQWYTIASIEVLSDSENKSIVCFGDSITDGRGTTDDKQNRWTDGLAVRLQNNDETKNAAVLNQGIGGTTITSSGVSRFNTDVLDQAGLSYVVILYGINDIIYAGKTKDAIINTYKNMIKKLHQRNVLVYGATILPFGKAGDYTAAKDSIREEVNEWIRTTSSEEGGFDACVDLDAVMKDPDSTKDMLAAYNCGDGLHPGPAGYQAMADAFDLELFTRSADFSTESTTSPYTAKNVEQFRYPLPKTVASGNTIKVNIKGENNGSSGFRIWTVADNMWVQTSESNIEYINEKLPSGSFDITVELVPNSSDGAKYILIKGPAYGTNIDNITFNSLTFTIDGKEYSVDPAGDIIL
ncbi:MAG: SGNH/GDSL hydrolase family protein [Treponema sp.]|nr:SGNH/GDSL hydrolase family protein [Treponema sp.]